MRGASDSRNHARSHKSALMFSDARASCRALSGDLQANCLQLPVVLVSFVCIALVKRRCFESPLCRRHRTVWRWDVQRQLMASVAGFTVLIVFARGLQGSDCLNLIWACVHGPCGWHGRR